MNLKEILSSPSNILRTIVAFANAAGGTVVIGVEGETHYVSGLDDPLLVEERLASLINDSIFPQILPDIEVPAYAGMTRRKAKLKKTICDGLF